MPLSSIVPGSSDGIPLAVSLAMHAERLMHPGHVTLSMSSTSHEYTHASKEHSLCMLL